MWFLCVLLTTAVLLVGSEVSRAEDASERWLKSAMESFEMYCYRTDAKYAKIQEIATAMKLRAIPEGLMPLMMAPNSTSGKGYLIEWNKDRGLYVLLGFSKPDACSIHVQGLPYQKMRDRFVTSYKLAPAFQDDVGLQVTEFYVPGGKTGKKNEARDLGLMALTYEKAGGRRGEFLIVLHAASNGATPASEMVFVPIYF